LSQQALHVLPMFLGMQLVMLVTRMVSGGEFPGVLWFLSSFTATLLWYPVTYLLLMPQFRPEDKDVHRPI
jgi:rod shape-determining protein MreD